MRIVHVADSFAPDVGGIEGQVEALARQQVSEGHQVSVITAVADELDIDLDVKRAEPGRWLTVAFPWRNYKMVSEVLDGGDIDVVHAHFTVISPVATYVAKAASRRGIPVAATVHSLWWKVTIATRVSSLPFGWGRIRAAWSGVSSVAAGRASRTLRNVSEVSVVPNLVQIGWWQPAQPIRDPGTREIRLVLVGRLKRRKHVNEFIDSLAAARAQLSPDIAVRVDVVGAGPRQDGLRRQITRLGLTDWVRLLGHRTPEQIRTLLHESDLFVASSRQEAFGIAALEARAAGLPVLGYHGNGLVDFIANGVEGVLVADGREMTEALVTLLSQPEELGRLRKTTATFAPSVDVDAAMNSVYALYQRAQRCSRRGQ